MKVINRAMKKTGKIVLVLFTAILMPVLIWIGLGVAINRKLREKRVRQPAAPPVTGTGTYTPRPVTESFSLLARNGNYVREQTSSLPCWEILNCPPEKRDACPAHVRRDLPYWVVENLGKNGIGRVVPCDRAKKSEGELPAFSG